MEPIRRKIVQILEDKGIDMKEASLAMGRSHSYLQQFIRRGVPAKLKEEDRSKLAAFLGVPQSELGGPLLNFHIPSETVASQMNEDVGLIPVVGIVTAGEWREGPELESDGERFLSNPGLFPDVEGVQVAYQVEGESMNRRIAHGDFWVCTVVDDPARQVSSGDVVIVERRRLGNMAQRTAKVLQFDGAGNPEFWPDSWDPKFNPFKPKEDSQEGETYTIVARAFTKAAPRF